MLHQDAGLCRVRLGEIRVERERPLGRGQSVVASPSQMETQAHLCTGHQCPGTCVSGVDLGCPAAEPDDR